MATPQELHHPAHTAQDSPDSAAGTAFLQAPVEYIALSDSSIALRRFGQGPALLLVHGFPLSGFTWRHLLPALSARYTCYVPDLPGLGDSRWSEATDFHFSAQAARLKKLVDTLGLQEYAVIAQDSGATTARCLSLLDPGRVRRLALINTEAPGHRPPWIREYQALTRLPGALWGFRQLLRSRHFLRSPLAFGGSFENLDLIDGEFRRQFVEPLGNARRMRGLRHYLLGIDWTVVDNMAEQHRHIRQPVLLLWGENDPTFPLAEAQKMQPQFPDCRLHIIPGSKLLPHEEQPAAVVAGLLPFLQGQCPH